MPRDDVTRSLPAGRPTYGYGPPRALGLRMFVVLCCALLAPGRARPAQAQDVGPLQVQIVGDTLVGEGDRVAYSIVPWAAAAEVAPSYDWDFGDGSDPVSRPQETAIGHRFMRDGEYSVSASAVGGATSLRVTVEPRPPVIEILSHDADIRPPGDPVRFQAAARDPGGDTLTYSWDFGDGTQERGEDLADLTHGYASSGPYEVTLVVTDEDGLEARRTITLEVNPGFHGALAGEVASAVEGVSGKATLMNPLGTMPMFTGAAPMSGGVADLSDAMGVCLVNAGFWDDTNRVHVNFQWTAAAERIWSPGTYPIQWTHPGGTLQPDQMLVNALVLHMEGGYQDTKDGAEDMQIVDGQGVLATITDLMSGALSDLGGGAARPGTNWTLHATGGQVTITRVSPDHIRGRMAVDLQGAWMSGSPEGSGAVDGVTLEGHFAWEVDEVARANLLRCGDGPFRVASHTPEVEAEAADYERPQVRVSFTRPVSRASVHDETVELGYVSDSGEFRRIDARIVFDENPTTVHLVPPRPLDDGIYHMVRVRGGEAGVKSIAEDPLTEDYQWRFSTMPELVRRPDAGSP